MIVVLDTNVLVAGLVAHGLCHELLERSIRLRLMASSAPLLEELDATLQRKFTITPRVKTFLDAYRQSLVLVVPVTLPHPVCRDADDDVVLGTAVAAGATVIVSGDQDLLVLRDYNGIPIINPRAFVEFLDRSVAQKNT
ncbi:MAG: putative toxin-antitoxin system toxin component, PIN family [Acidobacteria bacterium]|nr:putative toxin-antitoxin system toxin component, PIN family [Acidobacteriota bacterium]